MQAFRGRAWHLRRGRRWKSWFVPQPAGSSPARHVDEIAPPGERGVWGLVVNPALGDRRPLGGPYDFALATIQVIDIAVDSAARVPAAGTIVNLGVDLAANAGTGYLMYKAHLMDVVLYGGPSGNFMGRAVIRRSRSRSRS
jgi:hypothetical protein